MIISSNAYFIELLSELQLSPIHNVCNLFPFEVFDGEAAEVVEKMVQLPKVQQDVIEKILGHVKY
jgi:hypothetical protein